MKLVKLILGISISLAGSLAASSFAQSTQPSGCSWVNTGVQNIPSGAIVTSSCQLNGASIATREQKHHQYNPSTCSITWVASGYVSSGACDSAVILKYVTTSTPSSCNTGATLIVQTGPNGSLNPNMTPSQFCGQNCPYTVQPLDPYSYPRLKYTCN